MVVWLLKHILVTLEVNTVDQRTRNNWMAPWKNQLSSKTIKQKITCKASDAAEYIELLGSSTRDRHARCI